MWQVDNDRYYLWQLEHELNAKRIDRLLNSITTTDRLESSSLAMTLVRLGRALWRAAKGISSSLPVAFVTRRT